MIEILTKIGIFSIRYSRKGSVDSDQNETDLKNGPDSAQSATQTCVGTQSCISSATSQENGNLLSTVVWIRKLAKSRFRVLNPDR